MPTATRNRPTPAKKPAPDPLRLLDQATSPVDRLENRIHDQRRKVKQVEQTLADERRQLAFLEGKAGRIAALLNNGGALAREVDAKPYDSALRSLCRKCKQAPWVKLQRAGASDEQLATILKTGWPSYAGYSRTRAEGGEYGDRPQVFIDNPNGTPTLKGKHLIAEVRRVMGIPQPGPKATHKPAPAKKSATPAAGAASTVTITTSVKKKPPAKKGGKGGAGGSGAAAKAPAAAASKPAAADDDADAEDLDAAGEVPRPQPAPNDMRVVPTRAANDTRVINRGPISPGEWILQEALHRYEGAAGRWEDLRHTGATDAELRKSIAREFGSSGGSPDYSVRGGNDPTFWRGPTNKKPTLKGTALVDEVRRLMEIPTPTYSPARLAELRAKAARGKPDDQSAGDVEIPTIPAHVGKVTLTLWPDEMRGQWYCGADVDLGNLGKRVIRPLSRPAFPDRAAAIADTAGHLLDLAERQVRGLPRDKVVNGRAVVAALKEFVEDLPDPTPAAADPDEAPLGTPAWANAMGFGDQVTEQRARTIAALPADRRHLMKDARVNDAGEYHRPPAGGEEEVTRCGEAGELQLYLSRDGDGGWHAGHNLYWRRVSLGSHCERARVDGVVYEDRAEALQGELAAVLKLVDAIKGPPATKADQDDARAMGKHLRDWGRDQAKRATQAAAAIAAKAPPAAKPKPNGRGGPPLHPVAAAVLATGGPLVTGVAGGPLN